MFFVLCRRGESVRRIGGDAREVLAAVVCVPLVHLEMNAFVIISCLKTANGYVTFRAE